MPRWPTKNLKQAKFKFPHDLLSPELMSGERKIKI